MARTFFLSQAKHNAQTGAWDKGLVIKENDDDREAYAAALQAYHAYLGAYAYGHDPNTDYVCANITDDLGARRIGEVWDSRSFEAEEDV